jgi:hypothetical protein
MRSCKEITILVSESLDRELSLGERLAVRLHLMMCRFCSRYRKQLQTLRVVANRYLHEIEPSETHELFSLSEDARSRIQRVLADQMLEK